MMWCKCFHFPRSKCESMKGNENGPIFVSCQRIHILKSKWKSATKRAKNDVKRPKDIVWPTERSKQLLVCQPSQTSLLGVIASFSVCYDSKWHGMHDYIGIFRTGAYACSHPCHDVSNVITLLSLPHIWCITMYAKLFIPISLFNVSKWQKIYEMCRSFQNKASRNNIKQQITLRSPSKYLAFYSNMRLRLRSRCRCRCMYILILCFEPSASTVYYGFTRNVHVLY